MAPSHIVVSLLSAMAAAFAPEEHMKMMPMEAAVSPDGNVKMIRRAVSIAPNAEIASVIEDDKELLDIKEVEGDEGVHSDAFDKAYKELLAEIAAKNKIVKDLENQSKQLKTQHTAKVAELHEHQGKNKKGASWLWSQVKRVGKNVFRNTENRLTAEQNALKSDYDAKKADYEQEKKEVAAWNADAKASLRTGDKGKALLTSLATDIANKKADIEGYEKSKTKAKEDHTKAVKAMEADHKARIAAADADIDFFYSGKLPTTLAVVYSLSASCGKSNTKCSSCTKCTKCGTTDNPNTKACGDLCIAKETICRKRPTCACNHGVGHDLHKQFAAEKAELTSAIETQKRDIKQHENVLTNDIPSFTKSNDAKKKESDDRHTARKAEIAAKKAEAEALKEKAEKEKKAKEETLSAATAASKANVDNLEKLLEKEVSEWETSITEKRNKKTALIADQSAELQAAQDQLAAVIADWDARKKTDATEQARLEKEHKDLAKAVADTK